jgi:hypothetical protein
MVMSTEQCELHANRLRNASKVFTGVIALNSRGAPVFCPSGMNTGLVNADRDGIEVSAEQATTLKEAGALDVRPQAPDLVGP